MNFIIVIIALLILGGFLVAMLPRGHDTGDSIVEDREPGRD